MTEGQSSGCEDPNAPAFSVQIVLCEEQYKEV